MFTFDFRLENNLDMFVLKTESCYNVSGNIRVNKALYTHLIL